MARVSFAGWGETARRAAIAAGWMIAFAAVGLAIAVVLNAVLPAPPRGSRWALTAQYGILAFAFFAATWIVGWKLDKHTWDEMGWKTGEGEGLGRLSRGVFLGGLMAAITIGLGYISSGAQVRLTGDWYRWLPLTLPLLVGLVFGALFEELVFRGYPLRRLSEAIGPWAAIVVLVTGFGLAHLGNPNASGFGIVNVILAGVWLSFAFFSPGGMAYAWGLHFGWNAGLAALFDAPVSGYRFRVPAVEYFPGERTWVDGGSFGPEGGVAATVVFFAGTLAVLGSRFTQPRTWLAG
ncbi:MAG: lysostaphin resistance A-like protein [Gemmatimonadales bacterium]